MATSAFQRVGVVGCGLMGSGIAEVAARAGCDVVVVEADEAAAKRGRARIEGSLATAVDRGKLDPEQRELALELLAVSADVEALADRQLVVEAVVESAPAKVAVFDLIDRAVEAPEAVLASNTSSIPIMKLAMATKRPEAVTGLHFFNPVPVLKLVELVPSLLTSPATIERAEGFATGVLGKQVIRSQDRAGFVVNALLIPYLLSAIRMMESGFATAEDIDAGMVDGSAAADRPDRPRHDDGGGRVALRGVQGAALRPAAAAVAHGRRRAAGPQDRPRLLRVPALTGG
jgi:3-hydroxybutyryl-CoA dehydrogenase